MGRGATKFSAYFTTGLKEAVPRITKGPSVLSFPLFNDSARNRPIVLHSFLNTQSY